MGNPYWDRITEMADRQRTKGISTYGQGLEQFSAPNAVQRIEYIQEELIDAPDVFGMDKRIAERRCFG